MKVKALRGVCIGVERHMKPDDVEDLDPNLTAYLISIGAVERVVDPLPPPAPELDLKTELNMEPKADAKGKAKDK